MYGGCKQNGGNTQTCSNNLILYPGMNNRSVAGNTCLSANKFADSFYENNDCIADRYMGPVPESAKAAEASYLGARNRYYMPPAFPDGCLVQHGNTSSVQSCPQGSLHGNLTWGYFNSFSNYSAHGNDLGSTVLPPPSLMEIVRMAEDKLSMAPVAALKADDEATADDCRQPSGDPCLHLLSTVFGSHMVLQREPQQALVWGNTTAGAKVTTVFNGLTLHAVADLNGTWRQKLPPMPASKRAFTLDVSTTASDESKHLHDIVSF